VLFLGWWRLRRRKRLVHGLRRQGIEVVACGDWSDPAYWGEERVRLLNRAKIVLNLGRFAGEFSGLRMILGMANRALVVSEPVYRPGALEAGKHYVSASAEELPKVISFYLAHSEERERIAAEGHRMVTEELTCEGSVSELLRLLSGSDGGIDVR